MAKFQVLLAGAWKDYSKDEDSILKRSFMTGYPNCQFSLRGASYEYNFERMVQKNLTTGKERKIRAPHGWQQPAKPIVPKGPTLCMNVPAGSPGNTIQVDHPKAKGATIQVAVPKHAKVGQPMLVPIPDVAVASNVSVAVTAGVVPAASCMGNADCDDQTQVNPVSVLVPAEAAQGTFGNATGNEAPSGPPPAGNGTNVKRGWSTRAKIAAGGAVAALGGGGFLAAWAATEARDQSGGTAPPTEFDDGLYGPTDAGWEWSPPTGDGAASCPGAADLLYGPPADAADPLAGAGGVGGGAAEDDGGVTMCDGGEEGGLAGDGGIVEAEDDAEWLAEMCGYDDGLSGDGADAVADFVVDLF